MGELGELNTQPGLRTGWREVAWMPSLQDQNASGFTLC